MISARALYNASHAANLTALTLFTATFYLLRRWK